MELKKNINKIHSYLQDEFKEVDLIDTSSKRWGNYFEIVVKESNLTLKLIIKHKELESGSFDWSYLSNPNDENSIVERHSVVDGFTHDIKDIFSKRRFDNNYLKNII